VVPSAVRNRPAVNSLGILSRAVIPNKICAVVEIPGPNVSRINEQAVAIQPAREIGTQDAIVNRRVMGGLNPGRDCQGIGIQRRIMRYRNIVVGAIELQRESRPALRVRP